MLTIRLSRIGKRNKPMYRLIISEKARDPYGRALEILGSYNPFTKELQAKADRIKYWLNQGAGMSATVNNLLISKGVIQGEKVKASRVRKKKKGESDSAKETKGEDNKEAKSGEAGQKEDNGNKEEKSTEDTKTKETASESAEKNTEKNDSNG